jgi:hypothetical protein
MRKKVVVAHFRYYSGYVREKGGRYLQKPQLMSLLPSRSELLTSQNEALIIRLLLLLLFLQLGAKCRCELR